MLILTFVKSFVVFIDSQSVFLRSVKWDGRNHVALKGIIKEIIHHFFGPLEFVRYNGDYKHSSLYLSVCLWI